MMKIRSSATAGHSQSSRLWLVLLSLWLVVSLACALPGIGPAATEKPSAEKPTLLSTSTTPASASPATPQTAKATALSAPVAPLPPVLIETQPSSGSQLALNSSLTFYFNQAMQKTSVEGALTFAPALQGTFSWLDDATLKFTPGSPLTPSTQITVTLATSAQAANGKNLVDAQTLSYNTAAPLQAAQFLPLSNSQNVNPGAAVAVTFNQPVVALGADPAQIPAGFQLQPAAEGKGEWLNTSTYIFYPKPALKGGTHYSAQINPQLTSAAGSTLQTGINANLNWGFATSLPQLLSVTPQTEAEILLDQTIDLAFNQSMDPASVEKNLSLKDAAGNPIQLQSTWSEENSKVGLKPSILLTRGAKYSFLLSGQAEAPGGAQLGSPYKASYHAVDGLAISAITPDAGHLLDIYNGYGSFNVQFNIPLAKQDISKLVTIDPPLDSPNINLYGPRQGLFVSGYFVPNTTYTVTFSKDIRDQYDQPLAEPVVIHITTAQEPPSLLVPMLNIGNQVLFVLPENAQVIAQATNISDLTLRSKSLSLSEFTDFLEQARKGTPPLPPTWDSAWGQKLNIQFNRSADLTIPLASNQKTLTPGLYLEQMQSAQLNLGGNLNPEPFAVVVSRIHLEMKRSASQVLVWAINLDTNQPAANMPVSIYDSSYNRLGGANTDGSGIATIQANTSTDSYQTYYAVLGQPGEANFSLALSTWNSNLNGYNFGFNDQISPDQPFAYLYTDRPIYQPGQKVDFRVTVRQASNGRYTLADKKQITLKILGPYPTGGGDQPKLQEIPLTLSGYGTAAGSYTLPADAQPGIYSIAVGDQDVRSTGLNFTVAEYRKPDFDLKVQFSQPDWLANQDLKATLSAAYYFGAPAAKLAVNWVLYAQPNEFAIPGGFQTGKQVADFSNGIGPNPDINGGIGFQVITGSGTTGADGTLPLTIPVNQIKDLLDLTHYQALTLEATAVDQSNLPVSARGSANLHPSNFYIGAQPENWVFQASSEAGFNIQTVDWQNKPSVNHALKAVLQKLNWITSDNPDGQVTLQVEDPPVGSVDFRTDASGRARIAFTPPDPGTYQLEISGDGAVTQLLVWVTGSTGAVWPQLSSQKLDLRAEADHYTPGQSAHIFIPNPFTGTSQVLVTVERGKIMRSQTIAITGSSYELNLPLNEDDAPNIYVSATVIGTSSSGQRDLRMGYVQLFVTPQAEQLQVKLLSQPQRSYPGGEVKFNLQVQDAQGKPVRGEFSLALVDKALLALADPNSPDILDAFYGPQDLGVVTGLPLTAYGMRNLHIPPGRGGGGGAAAATAPPSVRENFQDTAYWNGSIETDANGAASVSAKLPDNLTTWVALVRGLTRETLVGEASVDVVATKDLLILPVTPRFLVVGDHAEMAAIVHNNTTGEIQPVVSLAATGFALDDANLAVQRFSLAAGEARRVVWWGTAQDVSQVELLFSANAGDLQDSARPDQGPLPVLHYNSLETFGTSGVLGSEGGQRTEIISLPRSFKADGGGLNVEMAPSLAADVLSGLDAMEAFPSDATETILSQFLPDLEAYRALQNLGVDSSSVKTRLDKKLAASIPALVHLQNTDGGWGWTSGKSSDPQISAYVLFGLSRASQASLSVDAAVLQKAAAYLQSNIAAPNAAMAQWEVDRQAFIVFVLNEYSPGTNDPRPLFNARDRLSTWAKALLAVSFANPKYNTERMTLLSDLEGSASRTATGANWQEPRSAWPNLTTPVYTSALVTYALARVDPASPLLVDAVRYLVAHRGASGAWSSSYESAWVLLALVEFMKGTGDLKANYTFSGRLNDQPLLAGKAGGPDSLTAVAANVPLTGLNGGAGSTLLLKRDPGSGMLYYRAYLNLNVPVDNLAPISKGLNITRSYTLAGQDCRQQDCAPLKTIELGSNPPTLLVHLTITVPETMYFVAVEDTIPAGTQIINVALNTSQQGGQPDQQNYDPTDPFGAGWGWWNFESPKIYADHIRWTAQSLPAGTYELVYRLSPFLPGEFRTIPARAFQIYFPEVEATSAGGILEIKP